MLLISRERKRERRGEEERRIGEGEEKHAPQIEQMGVYE